MVSGGASVLSTSAADHKQLTARLGAQVHAEVQRWGSSFKEGCIDEPCLWDPGLQLGMCGDFCRESSAAGAISSGLAMAERVEQHLAG